MHPPSHQTSFLRTYAPRHLGILLAACLLLAQVSHAQTTAPVDITADKLQVQHPQGKATFSGNVTVVQGDVTLKAPELTATYGKNGSGDVQELQATGGVTLTRGSGPVAETAKGDIATYTPAAQQLVFTGAVELIRGPNTLSGDKLVYNLKTGNAQVTNSKGPVRARFTPQSGKPAK